LHVGARAGRCYSRAWIARWGSQLGAAALVVHAQEKALGDQLKALWSVGCERYRRLDEGGRGAECEGVAADAALPCQALPYQFTLAGKATPEAAAEGGAHTWRPPLYLDARAPIHTSNTHTHILTHTHTHTHARTHMRTHARKHARMYKHIHTHIHTHAHIHKLTHMRTRTHPPSGMPRWCGLSRPAL